MTLNKILLFSILTVSTSCNGQSTSQISNNTLIDQNTNTAKGDIVLEISKNIWSILQDSKGNFWFGSNGEGVYRYDGKTLIQFTDKDGLCHNQVRTIQEDKSGNIYFGTGNGVSRFDGRTFTTLRNTESNQFSNPSNNVGKIEPDDLWFPGDDGAYRYDGTSLNYLQFPKTTLGAEYYSKYSSRANSPYGVYSIYKDHIGNVWFGTSNLGVCRYDGNSFTWITEKGLRESPVRSIFQDKSGNFWFGNSGLGVFHYDGKSLTNYTEEKGIGNLKDKKESSLTSFMAITDDSNGEIWVATYEAGAWRYDGKNITNYTIKDGLTSNAIMTIYKDKKGDLWFGTNGEGVCKFNGKTFTKFVVE